MIFFAILNFTHLLASRKNIAYFCVKVNIFCTENMPIFLQEYTMKIFLHILLCLLPVATFGQLSMNIQNLDNSENEPLPLHPLPSERQVQWNETEFYAFFHYGMNTYTGLEWGMGNESEATFAPTQAPNPKQWLEAVKAAGMKGGIAVVKHHDGFCLWPTETTTHSVVNAGNANGKNTNIPRDFAQAANELGMKYGFYISPWDRNSAYYGEDNYVTDVFLRQCAEVAQYGSNQFEMWFDGANGGDGYYGGAGGTRSIDAGIYYDMPNLRDSVHKTLPLCVMWGVGGEARWIGNEAGYAGETNWAMIDRMSNDNNTGALNSGMENGWIWEPGESDAKATSAGWFWHEGEQIKSAETLFKMYLETVGRNATFILNCPPDKRGILPDATVNTLKQLGTMLENRLGESHNMAPQATIETDKTRANGATKTYEAVNLTDGNKDTYWAAPDGETSATITFQWNNQQTIRYVLLQEPIRKGQRVKQFSIETSNDGTTWTRRGGNIRQTTIGYKRIIPLNGSTDNSYGSGIKAKYLRVNILDSRACPLLSNISIY